MSKVIKYMPELTGDEQLLVAQHMKDMTEEQAEHFSHVYRQRRRDPTTVLMLGLLGLIIVAGVHRFYLGKIGTGILWLLTGGLCLVGTIVDLFNHKQLAFEYNREQIAQTASLIKGAFPFRDEPRQLEDGDF